MDADNKTFPVSMIDHVGLAVATAILTVFQDYCTTHRCSTDSERKRGQRSKIICWHFFVFGKCPSDTQMRKKKNKCSFSVLNKYKGNTQKCLPLSAPCPLSQLAFISPLPSLANFIISRCPKV